MNETNKTMLFFVAAMVMLGLALFNRPQVAEYNVDEQRGQMLVEEFAADAPKRLRVTGVNEETGERQAFEVAEVDGIWTIPSKSGYPADATKQMAAAVEGVLDRPILAAIPAQSGDHAAFGLLDPAEATATSGETGFGTRIQLTGKEDQTLADLIVGREVKDAEGQYYVRRPKQDVVYQVELSLDNFSTDFANWIEKDLLGLTPFDVRRVALDDYSVETSIVLNGGRLQQQVVEDRNARLVVDYDEQESQWVPFSLAAYDTEQQEYVPFELAENQTLNSDALEELKTALDDLKIVDVERKPEGLSGNLQTGEEFLNSRETIVSLAQRGFLAVPGQQGQPELLSTQGEILITLKNGVEYVLRFGDLKVDADSGEQTAGKPTAEPATSPDNGNDDLNRYLFVMARFNESLVEKPQLEELPELPAATAEKAENPETDDETTDEETTGEEDESAPPEPETSEREKIAQQRKDVEQANQRKLDKYEADLAEARQRVEQLNARFGDWYYVIPNDVFKKIHLGREELIQAKEPAAEAKQPAPPADASAFGLPGTAIPGLPEVGAAPGTTAPTQPPTEPAAPAAAADTTGE